MVVISTTGSTEGSIRSLEMESDDQRREEKRGGGSWCACENCGMQRANQEPPEKGPESKHWVAFNEPQTLKSQNTPKLAARDTGISIFKTTVSVSNMLAYLDLFDCLLFTVMLSLP